MDGKRRIFVKFLGDDILRENGRLIFSIMYAFSSSGYRIHLYDNISHRDLGKCAKRAYRLDNLTLTDKAPSDHKKWIYLFDRGDRKLVFRPWMKKLRVKFDLFSPYFFRKPLLMPFPVHPVHASRQYEHDLCKLRQNSRKMRIFFSGDTKGYSRNRVRYPGEKLPRLEIIRAIKSCLNEELMEVNNLSFFEKLSLSSYMNRFVLVDTERIWVDDRNWLGILSHCDFFLSPPGIVMPMCHNIIEAMAVGSIPITNYPEWFVPKLNHMKNCIVFDHKKDLHDKISSVLSMGNDMIRELREQVVNYYEAYLKPEGFVRKIENKSEKKQIVLITTEKNMARNARKLGKRSFLIRENG